MGYKEPQRPEPMEETDSKENVCIVVCVCVCVCDVCVIYVCDVCVCMCVWLCARRRKKS